PLSLVLRLDPPVPMGYSQAARIWSLSRPHSESDELSSTISSSSSSSSLSFCTSSPSSSISLNRTLHTVQHVIRAERVPIVPLHTGHHHHYLESLASAGENPVLVQRIPLLRLADLGPILDLLRQQVVWNALYSSLFCSPLSPDRPLLDPSLRRTVELRSEAPRQLCLSTLVPHSLGRLLSLHIQVSPTGEIVPALAGLPGSELPSPTLRQMFAITGSLPLILEKLLSSTDSG
ncbi:MAG: hypothetical protein Q8P67_19455, partial [archaeon]|nr:hypothetical protein [archaeon]